jgi:hypothetical protein
LEQIHTPGHINRKLADSRKRLEKRLTMIPKISNALLSMLLLGEVAAFSPSKMSIRNQHFDSQLLMSVEDLGTPSRRKFMDKSLSILSTSMAIVAGASPAFADVSEGNALPQGAAQFSRVIRAKADLQVRRANHVWLSMKNVTNAFLILFL